MSLHGRSPVGKVYIPVGISGLMFTGAGSSITEDAQGEFSLTLATAATAYKIGIPVSEYLSPILSGVPAFVSGNPQDPFGFRLEAFWLWYIITSTNSTLNTLTVNQETMLGGAARAAATAFGGNLQVSTNGGALSGTTTTATLSTTASTNAYLSQVVLATPQFVTQALQQITAEWLLTTGATSGAAKVLGVTLQGTYGFAF